MVSIEWLSFDVLTQATPRLCRVEHGAPRHLPAKAISHAAPLAPRRYNCLASSLSCRSIELTCVNLPAVRATETNLELPTFENIRFKFFTSVPEHGNFRLPQMFYQGVTFGITALNSHDVEVTLQLPV